MPRRAKKAALRLAFVVTASVGVGVTPAGAFAKGTHPATLLSKVKPHKQKAKPKSSAAARGTANLMFSQGLTGSLTKPALVACQHGPGGNIYVSIVGPLRTTQYDLELEAYGYASPGTFTIGAGTNGGALAQLGIKNTKPDWSSDAGTLSLTSQTAGSLTIDLTGSSGSSVSPVHVTGTWSCKSIT